LVRVGTIQPMSGDEISSSETVEIQDGRIWFPGTLAVPELSSGVVVFAHGSGSSRLSPRNVQVARAINSAGFGTLLFDLLTPDEAADRANVFAVELLARRLAAATRWLIDRSGEALPIGYFGASTGAAAALWAARDFEQTMKAIVSRGGRPDLAGPRLPEVTAPTLLIVGGEDPVVLDLNREAMRRLRCVNELVIVPGATHLFEEQGALELVSQHAVRWFATHLRAERPAEPSDPTSTEVGHGRP
jgi:putative phosphoribosyl transferase